MWVRPNYQTWMKEDIYKIILDITDERLRQFQIWGDQRRPDTEWMTILVEEVGEAAMAIMADQHNGNPHTTRPHDKNLRQELVQSAAVILAWIEDMDRR